MFSFQDDVSMFSLMTHGRIHDITRACKKEKAAQAKLRKHPYALSFAAWNNSSYFSKAFNKLN